MYIIGKKNAGIVNLLFVLLHNDVSFLHIKYNLMNMSLCMLLCTNKAIDLDFCAKLNARLTPTSETTLILFVSYLANKHCSISTIKVYLSAIRNAHVAKGQYARHIHHVYSK